MGRGVYRCCWFGCSCVCLGRFWPGGLGVVSWLVVVWFG